MKDIKILHLTHTDIRYDSRILKELKAISTIESVEVWAIGVNDNENSNRVKNIDNFNLINLKSFSKSLFFLPRFLVFFFYFIELTGRFIFYCLKIKPNVVHCHDTFVLPIGVLIKFLFGSTIIYDAHELESQKSGQIKLFSSITLIFEKISWKYIDHFISVSDEIINWYELKLGKKESVLILNSPEDNYNFEFDYSSNYLRNKFKIPTNRKIFIYVGYFGKGRFIETYLEIFKGSDVNAHLVFLGYGPLEDLIYAASNDYERIHLHKAVEHWDVVNVVNSADVGLCMIENTSLSEYFCLPNKFFEYVFANLRVIVSDFPSLNRLVNQFGLGYCIDLNKNELLKIVLKIESEDIKINHKDFYEISWRYQKFKLLEMYNYILFKRK